ncbi:MAG: hypothetical protein IIV45_10785, partial [Lachnospiraceae bacterium]|nr:hypothetical protein [Lachnospiraceae bacterium]
MSEVAEFSKGNGYSKGDLCDVGTPIILYGRLYTKYETSISEVGTFAIPKSGSVYSKGGEVVVPASGETAEDIARAATVENAGILLGGDLNVVTPSKDINSAFLALSISNGEPQKAAVSLAAFRAAATSYSMCPWQYLGGARACRLPVPMFN